jgi:hypothetical protein
MSQIAKSTKFMMLDILLMILAIDDSVLVLYLSTVVMFIYSINECIFHNLITSDALPI